MSSLGDMEPRGIDSRCGREDLLACGVERFLPGLSYGVPEGAYARLHGSLARVIPGGEGCVLVDIESLGFIGRPLFLIGALFLHAARSAELIQYLARDYSEERAVLAAFLAEAGPVPTWVTFNGRTFDLPFLSLRAAYHRLAPPVPRAHLDLLPIARRCWGAGLPDCRLQTLAAHLCGQHRRRDIPGSQIPAAYHAFVRSGEPWEMLRILEHNAADLKNLLALYERAQAIGGTEADRR